MYKPDETESASQMTSNVGTLAGLTDDVVESTQHVGRCRNVELTHLTDQSLQLRPL